VQSEEKKLRLPHPYIVNKENKMSNVLEKWKELKVIVESIDLDVHKNAGGNASAGVRARKGLRALKSAAADLVKLTIELEKTDDKSKEE
jgi:hypothetical protein